MSEPKTVLLVEDNEDNRIVYATMLEHYGYNVVETANGASLDFIDAGEPITSQHYAFLIAEAEFDEIFGRIREQALPYWADPGKRRPGQINHGDGGRGVYFEDPDGHFLEVLTRPYGSGS